jgi:hypothetical protein
MRAGVIMSWLLACELQISYSREVDAQTARRRVLYEIMTVKKRCEEGSSV